MESQTFTCTGACHCGAVRYEVNLPGEVEVRSCNCSICAMTGYLHLTVAHEDLRLLTDPEALEEYTFNTGAARHLFCRTCGIKSYYQPRSHPGSWSVNLNCLDIDPAITVNMGSFDGQNWEENVHEISHLGD